MQQAIRSIHPGGYVGYVGVLHGVTLDGQELFFQHVQLHGGPAPVRQYLPELIELVWNRKIDPGKGLRPHAAARPGSGELPCHG